MPRQISDPNDKHVGARVRMRRLMLKMSQTELAEALGLTYQQVQKYEKGTNRISASRLQQISDILQVPISFFFEGLPRAMAGRSRASSPDHVTRFLATSDGLTLAKVFVRITAPNVRHSFVKLVEQIAA